MSSNFKKALLEIRNRSKNDKELGDAFESLVKVFLENDDTQVQQYSKVWFYSEWAKEHTGYSKSDIGIDLIAKLRDEEGYCAIQCKCYQSDHSISKSDLDSFISASASPDFKRLLLVDTSRQPLGKNAQSVFNNLNQVYLRIQISEFEASRIDWVSFINDGEINFESKKSLRDHQIKALEAVRLGLKENDRGKLIMACGTGKTFTSLRIAEDLAGSGKKVLYMVPSLALMSQTIREWKNDAQNEFIAFSACSDEKVGKKKQLEDQIVINLNDLAFPATTNAKKLSHQIKNSDSSKMIVVFSTYQSIDVISESQSKYQLEEFDLIICDEAHRTTGATLVEEDESNFVKIHSNENIKGKKRLYMTATPRIYGETARKKEYEGKVNLASMDDEEIYGKTLFYRGFGWAVENDLLTDYKVVVLVMDEQKVSDNIQREFSDGTELKLDDATKMVGCFKALAKVGIETKEGHEKTNKKPMKSALAFCQNINTSKIFASEFSNVVGEYISNEKISDENKTDLLVELFHVDGTFNAEQRNEKLSWLKDETDENICRVLTNARCLSEGVDVPTLDAIMFLHPRRSQIDIVQSVGRVMRNSKGKDLGYVILPITVAPGVSAENALNLNKQYEVVWQILNALRAHDERFDSTINKLGLGEDVSNRIEIIDGTSTSELDATTAVIEDIKPKVNKDEKIDSGDDNYLGGNDETDTDVSEETKQLSFTISDLSEAIKAKIVEKCGTRDYWKEWANDIAKIAQQHITRINSIVLESGSQERKAFLKFLEEIRDDLNPDITESDAIEMLAQHIITRPVFDTLFQGNRFTTENAVSKAMELILSKIYNRSIDTETLTLHKFYLSVQRRAADIVTTTGKQTLILELYDKFFRNAFPLMTQRLGIVYTPVEIVDFIINSVEKIMNNEFDSSLSNEGIHILDPFTGTGTFISRLLQSGIISKDNLKKKFKSEIHANEIVLLANYIACVNIESVYDELIKEDNYQAFNGIVLTDTFQLYEQKKDLIADLLPDNSERRTNQNKRRINVIVSNPPYSSGQTSANDNAANVKYKNLDQRIENTYSLKSSAVRQGSLYDSYIRAFRWATDRIGDEGIIGFVTNASWIDSISMDGFRKCLYEEFNKIYVFHLRGNARTSGELRRKEKGNVFGEGSRTPITITILVKNKNESDKGKIFFHDIGDYLDQKQKLSIIRNFHSISGIQSLNKFEMIIPDIKGNWINKGNPNYAKLISLGTKKSDENLMVFKNYSNGLKTSRDSWNYNFSKNKLIKNVNLSIDFYNTELSRYQKFGCGTKVEDFIQKNSKLISWDRPERQGIQKGKKKVFNKDSIVRGLYRPFTKIWLYADRSFNNCVYQIPKIFPNQEFQNRVIVITGNGNKSDFSCLMTDLIPDVQLMFNGQAFPLFIFDENLQQNSMLLDNENSSITPDFKNKISAILSKECSNEEIFYFVYALFHSTNFISSFKEDLKRSLPRIPIPKDSKIFNDYVMLGKKLGDLHVNYENAELYPIKYEKTPTLDEVNNPKSFYRVEKMKFSSKLDKSSIIFNKNITIKDIPLEAYEYKVNGKSAIEWVMERQCYKKDLKTEIINDCNDYANETLQDPKYPFELLQRVITLSLETIKMKKILPNFDMSIEI